MIQAARPMGKAGGRQILATDTVRNLVADKDYRFHDRGAHDLKGFEEPVRLFEVAWEVRWRRHPCGTTKLGSPPVCQTPSRA